MSWVYLALSLVLLSTLLSQIFKQLVKRTDAEVLNLIVWIWLAIYSFIHIKIAHFSFAMSSSSAYILAGASVLSFLGNFLYLRSMSHVKNVGFSVAISSTQTPLLFLISALFIGSEFKSIAAISLIIVIAGVFFVHANAQKNIRAFWYALGSAVSFSFMLLLLTILGKSVPISVFLFYNGIILATLFAVFIFSKKKQTQVFSWRISLWIGACAIVSFLFNQVNLLALQLAPNPAYISAIGMLTIPLTSAISYFVFKEALTLKQIVGMSMIVVGVLGIILMQI